MFKKNIGRLDRAVRLIGGGLLTLIGLFLLGGWQGHSSGVNLTLFALWPLTTGFFGFCTLYAFLGISTVEKCKDVNVRVG